MCQKALSAADSFTGTTESTDRVLLPTLIKLEEWFIRNIEDKDRAILEEVQSALSLKLRPRNTEIVTVNRMTDRAIDHLGHGAIPSHSPSEITQAFTGIARQKCERILIPPDPQEILGGDGEGRWEEPQFQPRLETLIRELNRVGIRTDELISTDGPAEEGRMRRVSYALLEVPRLWREILVCNQIGEASRVVKAPLGIEAYQRMTKSELDQFPEPSTPFAIRVICRDTREWAHEVITHLLKNVDLKNRRSIDIPFVQLLRSKMKSSMTPQEWVAMSEGEIHSFIHNGDNIDVLFQKLGLDQEEPKPLNRRQKHIFIGAVLFGLGNPEILTAIRTVETELQASTGAEANEKADQGKPSIPEPIVTTIVASFPSAQEFLTMSVSNLRVKKFGCETWQVLFDTISDGVDFRHDFGARIVAASRVYGESIVTQGYLQEMEELHHAPTAPLGSVGQRWIDTVKSWYPTGADWLAAEFQMAESQQKCFPFPHESKRELRLLILRMGYSYGQITSWEGKVEFGTKLYGEQDPAIAKASEETGELKKQPTDPEGEIVEAWRREVRDRFPSGKEWLAQVPYEFNGSSLPSFDPMAKNSPAGAASLNDSLGGSRWERFKFIRSRTEVTDTGSYRAMKKIAQRFGLPTNPICDLINLLELGKRIFPREDSDLQIALALLAQERRLLPILGDESGQWKQEIRKRVPDFSLWREYFTHKEFRFLFQIAGEPLRRLLPRLGVEWDIGAAVASGQAIFDLSDEEARAILSSEAQRRELEQDKQKLQKKLRKKVMKKIETPYEWTCMTQKERESFDVDGKGLQDLAKVFEMKIDPVRSENDFIVLGIQVFGRNLAFTQVLERLTKI